MELRRAAASVWAGSLALVEAWIASGLGRAVKEIPGLEAGRDREWKNGPPVLLLEASFGRGAEHRRTFEVFKRVFDLTGVIVAIPVATILVMITAILILITSGRPVFFIQSRVGLHGRVFPMIKLRTMEVTQQAKETATCIGDLRITPLGKFLRRYRIDELPQFLNVLRGEMSLIGPRPEQASLVEEYRVRLAHYDERHQVRPGITGWAQVMYGYASDVNETARKLQYDREYVREFSLLLDAKIVALTFCTLLLGRGVR